MDIVHVHMSTDLALKLGAVPPFASHPAGTRILVTTPDGPALLWEMDPMLAHDLKQGGGRLSPRRG